MKPPRFLFLQLNERCNLKCLHCNYWKSLRPLRSQLSKDDRKSIVEEFAGMNPDGTLVICGGEPMLDLDGYFHLCHVCRTHNIRCLSVVNGSMISTPKMAKRIMEQGPDEITISLDDPTPDIHDRLRGRPGAFDSACQALSLMTSCRNESNSKTKIFAMMLLCQDNYRHLDSMYHLALNILKADKLKINILQPTFNPHPSRLEPPSDLFFAQQSQLDVDFLMNELEACASKYHIHFNPEWLDQVKSYLSVLQGAKDLASGWCSPIATQTTICNSADRNIMIDMQGQIGLCFAALFGKFPASRWETQGDLKKIWEDNESARSLMKNCRALCGISHSVRRVSATLPSEPT